MNTFLPLTWRIEIRLNKLRCCLASTYRSGRAARLRLLYIANGDLSVAQAALAYFLNVFAPVISSHDDLGMFCSIPELLTFAGIVVNYIRDVKDAPEERGKILLEICSIVGFLYHLNDFIERLDEWTTTKWLGSLDGPLAQFKSVLEDLAEKFTPTTRIKKAKRALSWPFQKGGVADILQKIERLKTLFSLALLKDHM